MQFLKLNFSRQIAKAYFFRQIAIFVWNLQSNQRIFTRKNSQIHKSWIFPSNRNVCFELLDNQRIFTRKNSQILKS